MDATAATSHSAFALLTALSATVLATVCGTAMFDHDLLFFALAVVNSIGLRMGVTALVDACSIGTSTAAAAAAAVVASDVDEKITMSHSPPIPLLLRISNAFNLPLPMDELRWVVSLVDRLPELNVLTPIRSTAGGFPSNQTEEMVVGLVIAVVGATLTYIIASQSHVGGIAMYLATLLVMLQSGVFALYSTRACVSVFLCLLSLKSKNVRTANMSIAAFILADIGHGLFPVRVEHALLAGLPLCIIHDSYLRSGLLWGCFRVARVASIVVAMLLAIDLRGGGRAPTGNWLEMLSCNDVSHCLDRARQYTAALLCSFYAVVCILRMLHSSRGGGSAAIGGTQNNLWFGLAGAIIAVLSGWLFTNDSSHLIYSPTLFAPVSVALMLVTEQLIPNVRHEQKRSRDFQYLGYFHGHWADSQRASAIDSKAMLASSNASTTTKGDNDGGNGPSQPSKGRTVSFQSDASRTSQKSNGVVKSTKDSDTIAARMGLARLPTEAEMEDVWAAVEVKIHAADNARNLLQRAKDRAFRQDAMVAGSRAYDDASERAYNEAVDLLSKYESKRKLAARLYEAKEKERRHAENEARQLENAIARAKLK